MSDSPTCGVLIGTPAKFRRCGLPGDPCIFHSEPDRPRTYAELAALWGTTLYRWRREKQRQRLRFAA